MVQADTWRSPPDDFGAWYVEMDDFRAWREDVEIVGEHTNEFAMYPSGIPALAETEYIAVRRWDRTNAWRNSYMTNAALYWIPEQVTNGWSYLNPRRDYQNDVRLSLTATNVVEVRAAYSNFSEGVARICVLPELFPGNVRNEYKGQVLYAEGSRDGSNIQFVAYRQWDVGAGEYGRIGLSTGVAAYVDGQSVSFQVSTNAVQVYYGTDPLTNILHGLTNTSAAYPYGVYPHYEFQNTAGTTDAVVQINDVRCRTLSAFTSP